MTGPARGARLAVIALAGALCLAAGPPERAGLVFSKGKPLVLLGPSLAVGDPAPAFRVVDGDFAPVSSVSFAGQVLVISAVPSLDTKVCSAQTRRFNEEAARLPAGIRVLTVSMDLPFAQKRFCAAEGVGRIGVYSDVAWREVGLGYGLLVKDRGHLARAVFVVGRDGKIAYLELVREMSTEPDYARALAAARAAAR